MSVKMSSSDWGNYTTVSTTATVTSASNFVMGSAIGQQDFQITMPVFPNKIVEDTPAKGTFPSYVSREFMVYYSRKNKDYSQEDTNQNMGALEFVNVKELLARFFVGTYFRSERVKNWRAKCIGISSMVEGVDYVGNHMPMFDYDGNVKKKIRKDVAEFQDKYGLGDAWVYRTKKGFHVYFFCDQVSHELYMQMLKEADCCQGFKNRSRSAHYSILRISAKYTRFDIELEYVLKSKNTSVVKRPLKKAHVIQELISLGQQCGTHLASLYPQWARFREDPKEWRAPPKPKTRRVRRKSSKSNYSQDEILHMKKEMAYKEMYARRPQGGDAMLDHPFNKSMHEAEMKYASSLNDIVQASTHGFVSNNPESIYYVAEPKAKHVDEEDGGTYDDLGDNESEF